MGTRFSSWWQQIKKYWVVILIVAIFLVVAIALIIVGYRFDWTGFNGNNKSGKTLWDWLNLLGVLAIPAAVGLGTIWFTKKQGEVSEAENKDNQREAALQAYIDKMSELLLEKKLRDSAEEDEVRKIARVRTITILFQLDARRIGYVFSFLRETVLMSTKPNGSIVSLKEADLVNINLSGAVLNEADFRGAWLLDANLRNANLYQANLSKANLSGADLSGVWLMEAKLVGAKLVGANLSGADMSDADLRGANVTEEQLKEAKSLKGATMPDGSIHS